MDAPFLTGLVRMLGGSIMISLTSLSGFNLAIYKRNCMVNIHENCAMNVINVIIFEKLTLLLLIQAIVTDSKRWIGSEKTVTARPI